MPRTVPTPKAAIMQLQNPKKESLGTLEARGAADGCLDLRPANINYQELKNQGESPYPASQA